MTCLIWTNFLKYHYRTVKKNNLIRKSLLLEINLSLFLFVFAVSLFAQNGDGLYDTHPSSIHLSTTTPNNVKIKDMIGVNENGYVFWDWIYNSNTQGVVHPTVVNAFKSTFPKIRIFHLTDKDYNLNGQASQFPFNSDICPCTDVIPNATRNYMCANRDFYAVLRSDYDFISSASSVAIYDGKHGFPNGWFSLEEWGGVNAKQKAYEYILAYLQTMDRNPTIPTQPLVDRFYTSNEIWGTSVGASGYKEIIDGFIEGFAEHYQGDRFAAPTPHQWKIKMWLGAFQAHRTATIWGGDYIEDVISDKAKLALEGIDIHPYSFSPDGPNKWSNITEHPESLNSYFQSIKNIVDWRDKHPDATVRNFKISATEFGWNDQHTWGDRIKILVNCEDILSSCNCDCNPVEQAAGEKMFYVMQDVNGNPSTSPNDPSDWLYKSNGVGEEAQAIYMVRAYLIMARYGLESGYIYAALNNNETTFQNCGVYKSVPLIQQINEVGNFNINNYPNKITDFIGEKKVMPAMRKLQQTNIIGDKIYLESLAEIDNGVYAYLLGDSSGNPTHLVAWYATNINNKTENEVLAMTTTKTLSEIGFPPSFSLRADQNYTKLDWQVGQIGNISATSVYNKKNQTVTLTPIPIVIPIKNKTN